MKTYEWRWFTAGRMPQVKFENGDDIANLAQLDRKHWLAISMPTTGVRFDLRMLQLMDTDGDGRIRTPEVLAAVEFLKSRDVNLDELFNTSEEDEKRLADVLARQSDLAKVEPGEEDKKAMSEWEAKGKAPEVAFLGEGTAAAESALAAVESVIDAFFTPPEDMPLVTEDPDKTLPLRDHLNPKHLEAILDFAEKCVKPVLGDVAALDRLGWKKVKSAFAPYRVWSASKPVMNAGVKGELENEERVLRYKLHLLEFLENYVNMKRLYSEDDLAVFQTGTLRIDAKEMNLCFHVESEAAHSALAEKSNCCVIYLKLSRPSEGATRLICAVVTAGAVAQLYVGRNGVFYDRDGKDWEAVVTKVVENQVSLLEAFWAPWRKLGEGIAAGVKKFLGDKQAAAQKSVEAGTQSAQAGGAAMASSVAAVGIGVGMMGTAVAAVAAAVKGMGAVQIVLAIAAIILVVSLPSVILTWFKLRRRDIGAILNASGWAVNRPMRFSMKRARAFTKCACNPLFWRWVAAIVVVAVLCIGGYAAYRCRCCGEESACEAVPVEACEPEQAEACEAAPAEAPAAEAAPAPAEAN
ncbi:MAG: hypothetical protein J6U17_03340 [Kiritimatiellae bacterium]|nr:hypothetical protein [Kiritimatiellia bacterium]